MRTLSETIAEWACALSLIDIPEEVVNQTKMALVDTLSVAFIGSSTPLAEILRKSVSGLETPLGARTIGDVHSTYPAEIAAQLNASFSHALDFDDNSYAGFVHASAVVIPAALAVAQETGANGEVFLISVVAGLESELLIGEMTRGLLYEKGWWTTGVLGVIGAVVAAGRILGLTKEQMRHAIGLAVSGTGGMKACFGTDGKALLAGLTSANAIRHAKLAKCGASGPPDVFESEHGFFKLFNEGVSDRLDTGQPGRQWKILDPGFDIKEIPVCLSSHAAVEAVKSLKKKFGFHADEVESVVCDVPPIVVENLVYERPKTPQEAQFSLTYPVAVTLMHDQFLLEHLKLSEISNPVIASLMNKISMHTSAAWTQDQIRKYPEGADVVIRLRNGQVIQQFVGMPQGSKDKINRWDMLMGKAEQCLSGIVNQKDRVSLIEHLRSIDEMHDLSHIFPSTHKQSS